MQFRSLPSIFRKDMINQTGFTSPYFGIIFGVYAKITKFSANRNKLFCPVLNEVDLFAADNSTVELRCQLKRMS